MKEKQIQVREILFPVLFLVVTVCICIPGIVFLENSHEFLVSYVHVLPCLLIPAAAVFTVCLGAGWLVRKKKTLCEIYIDLIFGFSMGMYLQSNVLNSGLSQLDGTEIVWDYGSGEALLSIAVWIVCLALPHILRRVAGGFWRKISLYGSMLLIIMQTGSLVPLVLSTTPDISSSHALTKVNEFELSADRNTVVFVVDTLDAQWAEKYIIAEPAWEEKLTDFTYFNNVVSGGAPTVLGMPALLTGEVYDRADEYREFIRKANEGNELFADLRKADVTVRMYTLLKYLEGTDLDLIENAIRPEEEYRPADPVRFTRGLYKLTAFVGMPYQLKKYFVIYTGVLTNNAKLVNTSDEGYILDDPQFYMDFTDGEGIVPSEREAVFVLYHLKGAHGPYTMNENAESVAESTSSLKQQILGSMKIISEFISDMKEKGLYDRSTIIITADHGGVALYQNPAVFVKMTDEHHPLRTNAAPLTFRNLRATIAGSLLTDPGEGYGAGMFDVDEAAEVPVRQHTYAAVLHKKVFPDRQVSDSGWLRCWIGNPARNNDLIIPEEETQGEGVPVDRADSP